MKLHVCYRFLQDVTTTPRPGGHPCGNAKKALEAAGHRPEVVAVGGLGLPPLDRTKGRKEVERLTGQRWVPALEFDDGTAIAGSKEIIAWARANPASGGAAA